MLSVSDVPYPYSATAMGDVIRKAREQASLTQQELGEKAGYKGGAGVSMNRIEQGASSAPPFRLKRIAEALSEAGHQITVGELEARATARTSIPSLTQPKRTGCGCKHDHPSPTKEWIKVLKKEVGVRQDKVEAAATEFNSAAIRADEEFYRILQTAAETIKPPKPLEEGSPETSADQHEGSADDAADALLKGATNGMAKALAGGAAGGAAGAALGALGAHGLFATVAAFGTASTGASIAGLSGAAATNAALAYIGGGTLAAGGFGVAGGTAVLAGMTAAPILPIALGGYLWMRRRSQQMDAEQRAKLCEMQTNFDRGEDAATAVVDLLSRSARVHDDIATHGGRAVAKWHRSLGEGNRWEDLTPEQHESYDNFVRIAGALFSLSTIDFFKILGSRDDELHQLEELAATLIDRAQAVVDEVV